LKYAKKFLNRELKLVWVAISRVNYVNDEVLYWMRKAGCIQISYGVESGSEKIRKILNKNIKTDQIKKAFALTPRYGIMARAYFIYGCQGESWDTIQDTIDLIHEIKPLSIIFYILDIFPGTALYSDFKKRCKITDDIWLKRIEDIIYFQSDPDLSQDMILAFGQKLRMNYYENLAGFTDDIEVIDDKELYELHADFFSRLGMTFDYGDYANIEAIKDKDRVAERLYKKSLDYHPDQRSFLGLGIIKQKMGEYIQSAKILSEGVEHFPESEQLNICLGISCLNLREYNKALPYFLKFKDSKEANYYITACNEALGISKI